MIRPIGAEGLNRRPPADSRPEPAAETHGLLLLLWAASWERKQEITAAHTYFELGSFYYLANDPQVPANVRATYQKYGLCADGESPNRPQLLNVRTNKSSTLNVAVAVAVAVTVAMTVAVDF